MMEYKKHAAQLSLPKINKQWTAWLIFRHEITEALILSEKPVPARKRFEGPVLIENEDKQERASYKARAETRSIFYVRFDEIGHFPEVDKKKEATRF